MKPSTKKNSEDGKKKDVISDNKSDSTLHDYFKSAPKPFLIEKKINGPAPENKKLAYIQALKRKLQDYIPEGEASTNGRQFINANYPVEDECSTNGKEETDDSPVSEVFGACAIVSEREEQNNVLKKSNDCSECKQWMTKYKNLKKVYMKVSSGYAELDLKYKDLVKTKTRTSQPENNDAVPNGEDVFSPIELKILKNMPLDKKRDSTFINQSLEYAYKSDLSVLRGKTMYGKPERMKISEEDEVEYFPEKDPLTPKKVDRIKELFIERITKCNLDSANFSERIKNSNFNRLIASCTKNIAKKQP